MPKTTETKKIVTGKVVKGEAGDRDLPDDVRKELRQLWEKANKECSHIEEEREKRQRQIKKNKEKIREKYNGELEGI
ncbi:MAG: hypothetical protein LV479_04340 [Methylacidiphilales bacterium]|nr:hypothetical protein [Candidatus Methylacidiphilales bacterium]